MQEPVELSVVIPVYNSEKIFPELYRQLTEVLSKAVPSSSRSVSGEIPK